MFDSYAISAASLSSSQSLTPSSFITRATPTAARSFRPFPLYQLSAFFFLPIEAAPAAVIKRTSTPLVDVGVSEGINELQS
jgi:hypothetical protein